MNKIKIIAKVINKLAKTFTEKQVLDELTSILGKDILIKNNLTKNKNINEEDHKSLRQIYDRGPVEKLYTYSLDKFGFIIQGIRVDVTPVEVSIKKK